MKEMMKSAVLKFLDRFFPKTWYRRTSFSQDGEDLVLFSFYEDQKGYKGFYIDVGAHNPFRFSNTAFFYRRGWSGINIEPTPDLIPAFHRHRRRDINLNIAISNSNEHLTFYMFDEPALNSFDAQISEFRDQTTRYKIIDKVKVQTYKLAEVLDKNLEVNQRIDFLTIDAEGFDFEILKSNNWDKYRPQYILVEQEFDVDKIVQDKIFLFLRELEYVLVARTMRTSIYQTAGATRPEPNAS